MIADGFRPENSADSSKISVTGLATMDRVLMNQHPPQWFQGFIISLQELRAAGLGLFQAHAQPLFPGLAKIGLIFALQMLMDIRHDQPKHRCQDQGVGPAVDKQCPGFVIGIPEQDFAGIQLIKVFGNQPAAIQPLPVMLNNWNR